MQKVFMYDANQCLRASNINLFVYSAYESIVLDNLNVAGITNFGLEIKNNSNAGNIIDVSVYGSPNGIEYIPIQNNLYEAIIGPQEFIHVEFTKVTGFLRITIQTDIDINVDVYLHGNIT